MAEPSPSRWKLKPPEPKPAPPPEDRMPTNAELLHELRLHGAKPKPRPRDATGMSRRTRDYLLLATIGNAVITLAAFKLMPGSETATILRLVFTAAAAYSGLLWYIFYGVMSRY